MRQQFYADIESAIFRIVRRAIEAHVSNPFLPELHIKYFRLTFGKNGNGSGFNSRAWLPQNCCLQ